MMKKFFTAIPFLLLAACTYSQQLNQVIFSGGGATLDYISFLTDQGVLIRMTPDGKIVEWGIEVMSNRYNYYAPKLQPFMGRVEYYGPESDSIFRGKLKSIGTCSFTYYGSYESDDKPGKLRTIGTQIFDYYDNFGDKALRGKIRFAGNFELGYYSSFDDEAFRGKLKSIGSTPITYYSSFDDKLFRGKLKSISSATYTWYSSYDVTGYGGSLKSGSYRQNIGGITYILR